MKHPAPSTASQKPPEYAAFPFKQAEVVMASVGRKIVTRISGCECHVRRSRGVETKSIVRIVGVRSIRCACLATPASFFYLDSKTCFIRFTKSREASRAHRVFISEVMYKPITGMLNPFYGVKRKLWLFALPRHYCPYFGGIRWNWGQGWATKRGRWSRC